METTMLTGFTTCAGGGHELYAETEAGVVRFYEHFPATGETFEVPSGELESMFAEIEKEAI